MLFCSKLDVASPRELLKARKVEHNVKLKADLVKLLHNYDLEMQAKMEDDDL